MIRALIIISACLMSLNGYAQKYSRGYLDSSKLFFSDYISAHPEVRKAVFADSVYTRYAISDTPTKDIVLESAMTKVYKTTGSGQAQKRLDSITISRNELRHILAKFDISNLYKYTPDFFPGMTLLTRAQTDSIRRNGSFRKIPMCFLGLPVFIKKGRYLVTWVVYDCGGDCGYDSLLVFKNENGRWQYFGWIIPGLF